MLDVSWAPENFGCKVHIDDYENFPTFTIAAVDIETNGKEVTDEDFKIVCIGLCGDSGNAYVYFDIRPQLIRFLQRLNIVAHDGKRAEIPWLYSYGVRINQLFVDTKTMFYVWDSARRNYSLKPILEDTFGVKYPTYKEIITDKNFIKAACELDQSLYVKKVTKATKKNPEGLLTLKEPKEVTLDRMPREIVAAYNAMDILFTYKLWVYLQRHYDARQWAFFNNIEMPMTRLIYEMEKKGIEVDLRAVRRIHNENSKKRRAAKRRIFELAGKQFNINSPKHQLLPVLQAAGINVDGTDEDTLASFKGHPLVVALLEYRGFQKVCSTYTIPLYFTASMDGELRIHTRFSQNTITGRLSSGDPINLQNQPQSTRECFVARAGHVFVNADWSNIELRLPADFSGEPKFINEYNKADGGDIHTVTAALINKDRSVAKTTNFLLTNSGTKYQLSIELGCSKEEAQKIYAAWWAGYSVLDAWTRKTKRTACLRGGIGTKFGRWVKLPHLKIPCEEYTRGRRGNQPCTPDWRCRNCRLREETERSAVSIHVQGSASDINKMAALRLYRKYGLVPVVNVHDELMFEIPVEDAMLVAARVKYEMEHVVILKVPLVAEVGIGSNWKEAKSQSAEEWEEKYGPNNKVQNATDDNAGISVRLRDAV